MIALHTYDQHDFEKKWLELDHKIRRNIQFHPISYEPTQLYIDSETPHHTPPHPPEDSHNLQWLWVGSYTGKILLPSYNTKAVTRLLYKHFINPELPDNRRLTMFTTLNKWDVNPYRIASSMTPKGIGRYNFNSRKTNKFNIGLIDLIKTPVGNLDGGQHVDEKSRDYIDAKQLLEDSGFIGMGFSSSEMAKEYLIGEDIPIHIAIHLINKFMGEPK